MTRRRFQALGLKARTSRTDELAEEVGAQMVDRESFRILLVEDDPLDVESVRLSLDESFGTAYDLTVVAAVNGALDRLGESEFDIVVLDLGLPDSHGLEGLRRINKQAPAIPILVCSGADDQQLALSAIRNGAQDFVLKAHLEPVPFGRALTYARERKVAEMAMRQQAFHDPLTGLPNRLLLSDRLDQILASMTRRDQRVAVMYVDLDGFKAVNDTMGHGRGDELLISTAEIIRSEIRPTDTVARVGGDEFVIVISELSNPYDVAPIAERIIERVERECSAKRWGNSVSASIGISVGPENGQDAQALLDSADAAMYFAKAGDGGKHRFHDPSMMTNAQNRARLRDALRDAVANDEFQLHFQPVVGCVAGDVVRLEALLRWDRPGVGLLRPGHFMVEAESIRMLMAIDEWVLDAAGRQLGDWENQNRAPVRMSVNLSAQQFARPGLAARIEQVLHRHQLSADSIGVEISERAVMIHEGDIARELAELREIGIHVALDNYGARYASLTQLQRLAFDSVKIDRSLIARSYDDEQASEIVRSIIAIAHALGMEVTAEGVETVEQLELLQRHSCDSCQGFYFSPAVQALRVPDLMNSVNLSEAVR